MTMNDNARTLSLLSQASAHEVVRTFDAPPGDAR